MLDQPEERIGWLNIKDQAVSGLQKNNNNKIK